MTSSYYKTKQIIFEANSLSDEVINKKPMNGLRLFDIKRKTIKL